MPTLLHDALILQAAHSSLSELYAIETIDLSTIRYLNHPQASPSPLSGSSCLPCEAIQLELNLGAVPPAYLRSLVWQEPIEVLQLSLHLERALQEQNIKTLQDIQDFVQDDDYLLKGIGQGHLDEIQSKLTQYVEKASTFSAQQVVNFHSIINILTGHLNRLHAFILLDQFKLSHFCTLSAAESGELRRLSEEQRLQIVEQTQAELQEASFGMLNKILMLITDVLIKPWMDRRQGLANQAELQERLQRVSTPHSSDEDIYLFLSEVFFKRQFMLHAYLTEVAEGLYGSHPAVSQAYHHIIQKGKTYFYHPSISYEWLELTRLLYQEFALKWEEKPQDFIQKVLAYCPEFCLYQQAPCSLRIRRA